MEKSPISALNEFLVAKKLPLPVYEDLAKMGPQHQPTFKIRVSAAGHQTEAMGFTKQEAKTKACKLLLDTLKVQKDFENMKLVIPTTIKNHSTKVAQEPEINSNAIGDLLQLCQRHHLPEPVYKTVMCEGPDHMKLFTYECSLLQLSELGQAYSLKNAKKNAAFKVLEKLQNELKNNKNFKRSSPVINLSLSADDAIKKYNQIKDPFKGSNDKTCFKDFHKVHEHLHDKSPSLSKFISNRKKMDEEPLTLIQKIADELNVQLTLRDMNRSALKKELDLAVFLMQLGTTPPLSSMGSDENEAAIKLLDTIVVMST